MEGRIDRASALNDMATTEKNGKPNIFSIEFVLSNGQLRSIKEARRFMSNPQISGERKKTNREFYNLFSKDQILVRNADGSGHPYPVFIHAITRFNGLIVQH